MNNSLNNGFLPFLDEESLRSAIESVCAKFGSATSLKILPASRAPTLQCACFLRLESETAQTALHSELDAAEFDGAVAFFADADERRTGATM